jgi:hypothetical protein
VIVLVALAAPARADLHTFQIDETKSSAEFFLEIQGNLVSLGATALDGTFQLELGGSSPDWSGSVQMVGVDAWSLDLVSLLNTYTIQAGNLRLLDFDNGGNDTGTLTGGPPIASGVVNTEFYLYTIIDEETDPIDDWQDAADWNVEVSDDDYLGAAEPGWTPEARLRLQGSIGSDLGPIPFVVDLVGAEVPEPGTLTLLLGGMLMVLPLAWRRRRRPC